MNELFLKDYIENDLCLKYSKKKFKKIYNHAAILWHTLNHSLLLKNMIENDASIKDDLNDVIGLVYVGMGWLKESSPLRDTFEKEINKYYFL